MVLAITKSYESSHTYNYADNIYIIQQFYIPSNQKRRAEINECLKRNADLPQVSKIYLLGEKEYSKKELQLNDKQFPKISQHVIGHRMKYIDVFNFVKQQQLSGYIIFMNSDIFLDKTVDGLFKTPLASEKTFMSQLRFEFNPANKHLQLNKLFVNWITYSQDTWIYHTNYQPTQQQLKLFDFEFGKPGCDNKIIYLMNILGYKIINNPFLVKTYHVHMSQERNYSQKDLVPPPHLRCYPTLPKGYVYNTMNPKEDLVIKKSKEGERFGFMNENNNLYNYIKDSFTANKKFIIPRIAGVENNVAFLGQNIEDNKHNIGQMINTMKNNAGIQLTTFESVQKYSEYYLNAFKSCELYTDWEHWGDVYRYITESHNYITDKLCKHKKAVWAYTFDIFHSIYFDTPWTHALKGKKILIVSAFIESIKKQLANSEKIYGIELFPECTFEFIKPPQTQGNNSSMEWDRELDLFCQKLDNCLNECDIALVSAGGYGNLICNEIYKRGVSSVYVGGVLQMYFGILGTRWERERSDIVSLYKNEYWIRPSDSEKPQNSTNIEGNCYW
jgi:hypothetical protein